eukprot:605349-Pelagomonas_calceolata.AAC.5
MRGSQGCLPGRKEKQGCFQEKAGLFTRTEGKAGLGDCQPGGKVYLEVNCIFAWWSRTCRPKQCYSSSATRKDGIQTFLYPICAALLSMHKVVYWSGNWYTRESVSLSISCIPKTLYVWFTPAAWIRKSAIQMHTAILET